MNIPARAVCALSGAWDLLLDWPLSPGAQKAARRSRREDVAAAVPWLGCLFGLVFRLAAGIIALAFHPVAGAVVYGLLLAVFLEYKEGGRSTVLQAEFLESTIRSRGGEIPASAVIPLSFMLKTAAGYLLCRYGAATWGMMVIAGSFTFQTQLAMTAEPPLLEVRKNFRKRLWISFFIVSGLLLLVHPLGTLAAAFAVYFGSLFCAERIGKKGSGDAITLAGAWAEWGLLAAGLLLTLS